MVEETPKGAVPLSAAIAGLRDELAHAWWDGQNKWLRFKPSPVELTLEVAVTSAGKANAGIKWWLIEFGGELSRESVATQTVRLTLEPVVFDAQGRQVEFLIEADAASAAGSGSGEVPLDALG